MEIGCDSAPCVFLLGQAHLGRIDLKENGEINGWYKEWVFIFYQEEAQHIHMVWWNDVL